MSKHIEMADSDSPTDVAMATQRSFVAMIKQIISDIQKTTPAPGLTWDQLNYLLDESAKKQPEVFTQRYEA